ncbi:MAG: protein-disulfide reductase DsbD domain-containing protein [Flavisolibacter sp.]
MNVRLRLILIAVVAVLIASCGEEKPSSENENTDPVTWSFEQEKKHAGEFLIKAKATLQPGWHIYSQATPEGGPVPTKLRFQPNPLVALKGNVQENGKIEQHYEPLFEVDVMQFSDQVSFVQGVQVKPGVNTKLNGSVRFMACNSQLCMPAKELPFSVQLEN